MAHLHIDLASTILVQQAEDALDDVVRERVLAQVEHLAACKDKLCLVEFLVVVPVERAEELVPGIATVGHGKCSRRTSAMHPAELVCIECNLLRCFRLLRL